MRYLFILFVIHSAFASYEGPYINTVPFPPYATDGEYDSLSNPGVCFTGKIIDTTSILTNQTDTIEAPYPISVVDLNKNFLEPEQEFVFVYDDRTWRFMDSVTILVMDTNTFDYDICSTDDTPSISDYSSIYNRLTNKISYPAFDTLQFIYAPQNLQFEIGDYIKSVNYYARVITFGENLQHITEGGDTLLLMGNFDVSFRGEFEISDQPIPLHSTPITRQNTPKFHTITNQQLLLENPTKSIAKYTLINAQGKTVFQQSLNPGMEESIPMKSAQVLWLRIESEQGVDVSVVQGF